MKSTTNKIYVHFVDGVDVYIPVGAKYVSDGVYEIIPDSEFDYDDDATLFEFGNQDIVKVKTRQFENGNSIPNVAYELVATGDKRNLQKRLLTHILTYLPEPEILFSNVSKNDIELLLEKITQAEFMYPGIQKWLSEHKEKIKSLI